MTAATKPATSEYASQYQKYVSLVPDGDIVNTLEKQIGETLGQLRALAADKGDYRYAPDKWTVKELLGHVIDAERIFAYRALCFARNDSRAIAGFEQDDYVQTANSASRTLSSLIDEFESVRSATIHLFRSFDDAAWQRTGVASDNQVTVRALAYIIAGHERHHMTILRERY